MRIPLLTGTRVQIVTVPEGAVVLRPPPPPGEAISEVGAAVRDALRFPLAGASLQSLVPRGGRVTIVAELPSLPIPGAQNDPRQTALAATVGELERIGVPAERQTLLVAGGLSRRPNLKELHIVPPWFALGFRGEVVVHDVEDPELVELGSHDGIPLRANRALTEADAVVVVSAAETVLHGGPAALLAAGGPEALRAAAGSPSLLETSSSLGWQLALAAERELARRVPAIGVSLTLDHPRITGALRGYPYEADAVERIASSPLPRLFRLVPGPLRGRVLRSLPLELTVSAVFAGPLSVAHAEALLRAIEWRSSALAGSLDAICIAIPHTTPQLPRERPNPLVATYLGLGLALRLWRDRFPVAEGGTAILLHRFHRHFTHPTQQPYRAFFQATRAGPEPAAIEEAERAAAADARAIEAYRSGRGCHPLLPFADWDGCRPALEQLGAVLIAGCRDATAARNLGFVPTHGLGAAFEMTRGWAERPPRIGLMLAPPYFPLRAA